MFYVSYCVLSIEKAAKICKKYLTKCKVCFTFEAKYILKNKQEKNSMKGRIYEQMAKNRVVQFAYNRRMFFSVPDIGRHNTTRTARNASHSVIFGNHSFAGFGGNIEISFS